MVVDELEEFLRGIEDETRAQHAALNFLPKVYFPRNSRLPRVPPGWFDLSYTVTFDGKLAILRSNFDALKEWRRHSKAGGSRKEFRPPANAKASFVLFDGVKELEAVETALNFSFPFFDRLSDGSWIVADNIEGVPHSPNAAVIGCGGEVLRRLELGCDIQQLQADPVGGFWVGYGDVGCFAPEHGVEAGGVVRFDESGAVWNLNDSGGAARHAWCDHSYALNITRHGRWSYTYSRFLLTRLDAPGGPRSLRPMVEFADAVAVSGERIMLAGSYRPAGRGSGFDRLVLMGPPSRHTPRRPSLIWMAAVHRAINPVGRFWGCRGDTLHCVRGRTWHRMSIDEAHAQVRAKHAPHEGPHG